MIGVILGPMVDENLGRALMVSQGSFLPIFTQPVALVLLALIFFSMFSPKLSCIGTLPEGYGNAKTKKGRGVKNG